MSRQGHLLIAHPNLPKGNPFYRTVIYIFSDNSAGTTGLILNKPTSYPVYKIFRGYGFSGDWILGQVYFGGPVTEHKLHLLHSSDWYSQSTVPVDENVSISSDSFMIEKLANGFGPREWRMTSGICAWQAGQLNLELQGKPPYRPENSWLTAIANRAIVFDHDGENQWKRAVQLSSEQMIDSYF